MTDQMESRAGKSAQQRPFFGELLHIVLPELSCARRICVQDSFRRKFLRYRHYRNVWPPSATGPKGALNSLLYARQTILETGLVEWQASIIKAPLARPALPQHR